MNRTTRIAVTIVALNIVALGVGRLVGEATSATHRPCPSITKCRESISWNHSIVATVNERLAIADGVAASGGRVIVCHTLPTCQALQHQQESARIWAEGAWQGLQLDWSPNGLHRITRYLFHQCGSEATMRALNVEGWESDFNHLSQNAALDTGPWQYELPAHPDISYSEAVDGWWSTERAVRDTDCGVVWSPMWSSVEDHGFWWA